MVFFIGCKEASKENSKYRASILKIDTKWNEIDSAYKVFEKLDHEKLKHIAKESKIKHKLSKKQYISDTLIPSFDEVLAVFKGRFVKGLNGVINSQKVIENEYPVSAKQVQNLNHDLINELLEEDTANLYVNSEINILDKFRLEINAYNSKANMALNTYDSLVNALDSIVNLYGKK